MISFSTSERFRHMDAGDLDRIEALTKLDRFGPGEDVVAPGRTSEWLGILSSGALELRAPGRRGEVTLARLGPGDLYGELDAFARLPDGVRLVAREDTLVRACPKNPLLQELRARRPLAVAMLFAYGRSISEKIRAANDALVALRASAEPAPAMAPSRAERPPHLGEDELHWLALLGRPTQARGGELVVGEGDGTRCFYVVSSGLLEVRRDDVALARLGPRDLFGLMSFIDGRPRSASVVCLEPAELTMLESDVLHRALGLNFSVAFRFLGTLCSVLGRTFGETAAQVMVA